MGRVLRADGSGAVADYQGRQFPHFFAHPFFNTQDKLSTILETRLFAMGRNNLQRKRVRGFRGSAETVKRGNRPVSPYGIDRWPDSRIAPRRCGEETERSLLAAGGAGIKLSSVNIPDENSPRDAEVRESISGENSVCPWSYPCSICVHPWPKNSSLSVLRVSVVPFRNHQKPWDQSGIAPGARREFHAGSIFLLLAGSGRDQPNRPVM